MHISIKLVAIFFFVIVFSLCGPVVMATESQAGTTRLPDSQTPRPTPSPSPTPLPKHNINDMSGMPTPTPSPSPSPASKHEMNDMPVMPMPAAAPAEMKQPESAARMEMGPLLIMEGDRLWIKLGSNSKNSLSMDQLGSGTSWQPASSPSHMVHKDAGGWLLMLHYNLFAGLNVQGGPRGSTTFESANWLMGMAYHQLGPGTLQLRGMVSAEPLTFPRGGSPLLFQTGETYKGRPLIDRQHPHDLVMELSSTYTVPLGDRATWFVYLGYPGEPALGPVAFMHRASASENPSAPLAHHLQDSTHITFGVFTTGFTYRWLKLEGSVFNGREPDENRYNFEAHPWDSRSIRLSLAPQRDWSLQVSHGFLKNPEALEPGTTRRTTASLSYNRRFNRGNWASSLIWGRNHETHAGEIFNLNGYAGESTVNFKQRNYLYTRLELVDKNQLLSAIDRLRLGFVTEHPSFRIGAYTFGGARDVWTTDNISLAIGGDVTWYSKPSVLNPLYGEHPGSYRLFVRLRPAGMKPHQP